MSCTDVAGRAAQLVRNDSPFRPSSPPPLAGLSTLEKAAEAAAGVVDDACEPLTAHAPALLAPNDTPWDPAGTLMPVSRHRC
jgi:hypothetical protein